MTLAPKGEDWKEKGKGSKGRENMYSYLVPSLASPFLPPKHQEETSFSQSLSCVCLELPVRFLTTNTKLHLTSMT